MFGLILASDGYGSQNSLRLYFGLGNGDGGLGDGAGEAPVVEELRVLWPRAGTVQTVENVAANRIIEIREGSDEVVEKVYSAEKSMEDTGGDEDASDG